MTRKKRIVIALGGNALGNTLPEQMAAVKITAHAIVDLIEEGCEVVDCSWKWPSGRYGQQRNARSDSRRCTPAQYPSFCLCCHEPSLYRL